MRRIKRLITLVLLALSVAVGVWWLGHIPYDPLAIYRPIPASASLAGRHLELPARWGDLLENPLALALLRTAGVDTETAAWWIDDEESRAWFEQLAGREATVAYLPGRFGAPPAWMAVSQLGGASQKLRWQLSVFRVPGFERMTQFPRRPVWRVETPDLDPRQNLVIAFGEGVIMACLSESLFSIAEVLGAYDGTVRRLMDEERSFQRFAQDDARDVPDRLWVRDESAMAAREAPGIVVDIRRLRGDAISLSAASDGVPFVRPGAGAGRDIGPLARRLGAAPCAVAMVGREVLAEWVSAPELQPDLRHAIRMVLEVADESVAVVFMDGDLGGRLAWGPMRTLGLSGLRVPTLLLATPVAGPDAVAAAIQRALDLCNARYRAAFIVRPVVQPNATLHVLQSAAGDEWVDALARSDRPAFAVIDGWLLAASNFDALQKLVAGQAAVPDRPEWAEALTDPATVAGWLDLGRSGKVARDAIATWSMAQMFLDGADTQTVREQLNEIRTWIDALVPFGRARFSLGRAAGQAVLAVDLGLSPEKGPDRMPAP